MVGADVQSRPGVVVEPGDDLGVGSGAQAVVGEVGLPGLVGLFGLEADVGGLRPLLGLGGDESGAFEDAVDARARERDAVVMVQVPGDGLGAGVGALGGEVSAQGDYECCGGGVGGLGARFGASAAGLVGGLAVGAVLGHEAADPALGDAVGAGGVGLGGAGEHGGDDEAAFRHGPAWLGCWWWSRVMPMS